MLTEVPADPTAALLHTSSNPFARAIERLRFCEALEDIAAANGLTLEAPVMQWDQAEAELLTRTAMADLRDRFAEYRPEPNPTENHWRGLREIVATITRMALEIGQKNFFLSSLPTGIGKTSAVTVSVKAIVAHQGLGHIGIVLFVAEHAQIETLIADMGLREDQYAVRVQVGHPLNYFGLTGLRREIYEREKAAGVHSLTYRKQDVENAHRDAQVLITTQQKLDRMIKQPGVTRDFDRMKFFCFRGKPRQVRIWDEAIEPSEAVTITVNQVGEFLLKLNAAGQHLAAEDLEAWQNQLRDIPSGSIAEVPTWPWFLRVDPTDQEQVGLLAATQGDETYEAMFWLSGREVRVHRSNVTTVLTYRQSLPHNFGPLIVLDASGQQKQTYKDWAESRSNLVELYSPGKTYRNLRIRHWDNPASKAAHRYPEKVNKIARGVAVWISQLPPNEPVLIIYRKPEPHPQGGRPKMSQDIRPLIKRMVQEAGDHRELVFVNWGAHRASNASREIKHTIIIGANLYSPARYEAMTRAAKGVTIDDSVSKETVRRTREGEVRQNFLQAAGRSAIRIANGEDCPEGCSLLAIYSTHSNEPLSRDLLAETFPSAKVEDWEPFPRLLQGGQQKSKQRPAFVKALLARMRGRDELRFTAYDFPDEFSSRMVQNFCREDVVKRALAAEGLELDVSSGSNGKASINVYRLVRVA